MTTTPHPATDAAGPQVADVAQDANHGSYCPKMCTYACPVSAATGREDAVPWGFHRTVSDLATGRLPLVDDVADRLTACSGCLACRQPCAFDQDVPAQVRAGRAALVEAGVAAAAVTDAVAHVRAGRTPNGQVPVSAPEPAGPDDGPAVRVVAGCRDEPDAIDATVRLLVAAGERVTVTVPDGCCGALLDDLGAAAAAADARTGLAAAIDGPATLVATDPHCLAALRTTGAVAVTDLPRHLAAAVAEGRLRFRDAPWPAAWHDPCVLARGEGVTAEPRQVLAAAGAQLREPEQHGVDTGCSGAGLGLDLLDPQAADATARARVGQLPPVPVVTGCARARQRLAAAGAQVQDLAVALQERLADDQVVDTDPADTDPAVGGPQTQERT